MCANLCCCKLTAEAAPSRDLDAEFAYEEADGRIEARTLEVIARCIIPEDTQRELGEAQTRDRCMRGKDKSRAKRFSRRCSSEKV